MIRDTIPRQKRRRNTLGLHGFCHRLCRDANPSGFIVAIARKMPRLLEYTGVIHDAPCPVITERALAWLYPSDVAGKVMVFCDDILNVGTTLRHYSDYASQRFGVPITIRVYGKREGNTALHKKSPLYHADLQVHEEFDESAYWQFETALPVEILTKGKPYAIDFPIIEVPIDAVDAERTSHQWEQLFSSHFSSARDLTVPAQREAGVSSISVVAPSLLLNPLISYQDHNEFQPPPKFRIYVSRSECLLRVVPMCIPPVHADILSESPVPLPERIAPIYAEIAPHAGATEPFEFEPRYNLLVYLLSFEYGTQFIPHLAPCLTRKPSAPASLSPQDLQFAFGPRIGQWLFAALTDLLRAKPSEKRNRADEAAPTRDKYAKPDLAHQLIHRLLERGYENENVARVFREMLRILDREFAHGNDPELGEDFPPYRRLRNGLPLCDIWRIVRRVSDSRDVSLEEMSYLLDYYIDLGVVVPVVEQFDGVYLRTYRRGEADPIEFAEFMHGLIKQHDEQLYPGEPLATTSFTKILSAIAIYHRGRVPLDPLFDFRGMRPYVVSNEEIETQVEDALSFLKRKGYITLEDAPPPRPEQRSLFDE